MRREEEEKGLPPSSPPPLPLPSPHAVAVLAVRLSQLAAALNESDDDDQDQEHAEQELCNLLVASAPRMQFPNVAGALGALGRMAAEDQRRRSRRRPGAGRRRTTTADSNLAQVAAATLAARLAECPVAREARGDAPRAGFWLARAAVGLARLRGSGNATAEFARAWARVAALSGALAPRLSAPEFGAVCWALGRSVGGGGRDQEDEEEEEEQQQEKPPPPPAGPSPAVLEFALDALAARAAEVAPAMTPADLCCAMVGLARAATAATAAAPTPTMPPPGVAAALPALARRAHELATTMEPRHAVGAAFALARLERASPRRRGRLASGASAEGLEALVSAAAEDSPRLSAHEACVLAWSAASLASRGARLSESSSSRWLAAAKRALVDVALPAVEAAAAAPLPPHDAGMLAAALAAVDGSDGSESRRLSSAAARSLVSAGERLPLRTAVTALWALTRHRAHRATEEEEDGGEVLPALLRRCERALAAASAPAPPLPPREMVVLALSLGKLVKDSDASPTQSAALRCLELLSPWLRAGCRRLGARELAAVACAAGATARVSGGDNDAHLPWARELLSSAAAAFAPLASGAPSASFAGGSAAAATTTAWEAARVLWAAAAVGGIGSDPDTVLAWAACCRRLLVALRSPDERIGAACVSKAAWALAARAKEEEAQTVAATGGRNQQRRQRALARALAARANVLLALNATGRPLAPELVVTAADAARMRRAFAVLRKQAATVAAKAAAAAEAGDGDDDTRGRGPASSSSARGSTRSASRSRSRSRRRAVLDSPTLWRRLDEQADG
jgi:hypothetical protein